MKFTTQNQKNHSSQNNNSEPSDSMLQQYDLQNQELQKTIQILEKIKKIHKDCTLTKMKKKSKRLNNLFGVMSQFFHYKKNQNQKNLQERNEQRFKRELIRNQNIEKRTKRIQEKQNSFMMKQVEIFQEPQIQNGSSNQEKMDFSEFNKGNICYICRKRYQIIDQVYPKHCPPCAEFGKIKRNQTANLLGYTALVTGGRIKIGFQIVLKLLRDGATVYATSRFSHDALMRFQKEHDFQLWKDRLFIIQCDFMSVLQIEALIKTIKQKVQNLDILINNAAQTIVRPKQFFIREVDHQFSPMTPNSIILAQNFPQISPSHLFPSITAPEPLFMLENSQDNSANLINLDKLDPFGQPTDNRNKNSWVEKIEDTTLIDCLTTQTINSTVPFYIVGQLKCLMGKTRPAFVINVSSMEGVFYRRYKSSNHAHTNMAKAALNMMTRTCAFEFSNNNIYMNAVDTGWVTNQNPLNISDRMSEKYKFKVPLDCLQGAMRVLDPIYEGVNNQTYKYGKFLKDYKESFW